MCDMCACGCVMVLQVVTMDGTVFERNGFVSGGTDESYASKAERWNESEERLKEQKAQDRCACVSAAHPACARVWWCVHVPMADAGCTRYDVEDSAWIELQSGVATGTNHDVIAC